jgi:hypothetical protein
MTVFEDVVLKHIATGLMVFSLSPKRHAWIVYDTKTLEFRIYVCSCSLKTETKADYVRLPASKT